MNEQEAKTAMARWCFTPGSQAALQFLQNAEYIPEIHIQKLDPSEDIYLIFPRPGYEQSIDLLCAQNGFHKIPEDRGRSFLAHFRQRYGELWRQLVEKVTS